MTFDGLLPCHYKNTLVVLQRFPQQLPSKKSIIKRLIEAVELLSRENLVALKRAILCVALKRTVFSVARSHVVTRITVLTTRLVEFHQLTSLHRTVLVIHRINRLDDLQLHLQAINVTAGGETFLADPEHLDSAV